MVKGADEVVPVLGRISRGVMCRGLMALARNQILGLLRWTAVRTGRSRGEMRG